MIALGATLFLIIGILYGILASQRGYQPFPLVQKGYMRLFKEDYYETVDPELAKIDPNQFIDVESVEDIELKRKVLIQYIWNQDLLPDTLPSEIEESIVTDQFPDLPAVRVDKFVTKMEYGFDSIMYLFHPANQRSELVIYHQGHGDDDAITPMKHLLEAGYPVLFITMPLAGENTRPTMFIRPIGEMTFTDHDQFMYLHTDEFNPLKLYAEPVVEALNYANQKGYDTIHMVGLSGGGWATTLMAAIDKRISKSYPVAGSLPHFLRLKRGKGDWEQNLPGLYRIATVQELYIMGALGDERKQMQVLNQFDRCCFSGTDYLIYEDTVHDLVEQLGNGNFSVFLDDTHREHIISERALSVILKDMEQ